MLGKLHHKENTCWLSFRIQCLLVELQNTLLLYELQKLTDARWAREQCCKVSWRAEFSGAENRTVSELQNTLLLDTQLTAVLPRRREITSSQARLQNTPEAGYTL